MKRWRLVYGGVLVGAVSLFGGAANCWAHSQSGPPYLMVNGVYADTNPISGAAPDLIPLDYTPNNSYVAGSPIEFAIDLTRVGVPTEFQWKWSTDQAAFEPGNKLNHTYGQSGSYIITLQARNELTNNQFVDYDTVQVNVVPKIAYKLPSAQVTMSYNKSLGGYDVSLIALDSHDPATKIADYTWLLGDGEQASGRIARHTYQSDFVRLFPILVVKDNNGLSTAVAFELDQTNTTVTASSLPFMPNVVTTAKPGFRITTKQAVAGGLFAAGLVIGIISLWQRKLPSDDGQRQIPRQTRPRR